MSDTAHSPAPPLAPAPAAEAVKAAESAQAQAAAQAAAQAQAQPETEPPPRRRLSPRTGWLLAAVLLFLLLAVMGTMAIHVHNTAVLAHDEANIREVSNGLALYHKKYGAFPCFTAVGTLRQSGTIPQARTAGGLPATKALVLLLRGGFVENPQLFFSPRDIQPTDRTLTLMCGSLSDPRPISWDPFFSTYAYDPGHTMGDGRTVFFGNRLETMVLDNTPTAIVLDCYLLPHRWEPEPSGKYLLPHPNATDPLDDLYADDSPTLGWYDSFLQWDVPAEAHE